MGWYRGERDGIGTGIWIGMEIREGGGDADVDGDGGGDVDVDADGDGDEDGDVHVDGVLLGVGIEMGLVGWG